MDTLITVVAVVALVNLALLSLRVVGWLFKIGDEPDDTAIPAWLAIYLLCLILGKM